MQGVHALLRAEDARCVGVSSVAVVTNQALDLFLVVRVPLLAASHLLPVAPPSHGRSVFVNPQEPSTRTGVAWNVRRVLTKTPSRRHFESKRTSKTGSTSKIGSRNGFVRFGKFCIVRSLSPYGVLNSGHKLTVTYYGEITIEPILNPEFDVDHDFEVKNGCFQSLFPRFRVISVYSTGRASHSDHFSGQVLRAL